MGFAHNRSDMIFGGASFAGKLTPVISARTENRFILLCADVLGESLTRQDMGIDETVWRLKLFVQSWF